MPRDIEVTLTFVDLSPEDVFLVSALVDEMPEWDDRREELIELRDRLARLVLLSLAGGTHKSLG